MSRKFSNLEVPKQLITITQSHEQNYKNSIGDPQLFHGKRINPAFSKFMTLLEGMRISDKDLGGKKRENCQLTNLQLFQIILILPFMAVPGFSHYAGSSISKLFGGKKDLLYSFMAKDNID